MKRVFVILGILFISLSSFGAEKRVAISFRAGLYSPSSQTYNDDVIPPINNMLTEFTAWLSSAGLNAKLDELDEIKGGMTYGGEIEFFVVPQFSLAFGAELWKKKPSASVKANGVVGGDSYDISEDYQIEASLTPLLLTLRVNLSSERFRAYLGGGAGYYMGKILVKDEWDWKENGVSFEKGSHQIESTGESIIPHVNGGFDFDLSENLSISADLRYSFGTIKSFEIKKDTTDPTSIGKNLTYEDVNGVEKDFKWELSGFNFGVNLKIKF